MNAPLHVVVGSGPVGMAVVDELLAAELSVRLISRNPRHSQSERLEQISCDATDSAALSPLIAGATTVYHCANAPYHLWPQLLPPLWQSIRTAAAAAGARLVVATNLYAFGRPEPGEPLRATSPFSPCSRKGEIRATLESGLLESHRTGELPVVLVRASDFYGPAIRDSVLGERFFGATVAGKKATLYGSPEARHSYAFVPDFAATMVAVGRSADEESWGRTWIVPHDRPVTSGDLSEIMQTISPGFSVTCMKRGTLRLAGLFVPAAREMVEMFYEFEDDFIADGSETERRFGLSPTPLETGLRRTLSLWKDG